MTGPRSQTEQHAEICQSPHHRHEGGTMGHIQGPFKVVGTSGGDGDQRVKPTAYRAIQLACVNLYKLGFRYFTFREKKTNSRCYLRLDQFDHFCWGVNTVEGKQVLG